MHAVTHHLRNGLRLVYDVALVAAHFTDRLDWAVFTQRAREWHAQRAVFLLLWLAANLLQAPIPARVIEELRPPDFSPEEAELACQLTLTPPGEEAYIPPHLAELVSVHGLWPRLHLVLSQLFLPIAVMRRTYAVRPGSWAVLCYYPVRWWDLLKRGLRPIGALLRGDAQTRRHAAASHTRQQQEERLKLWLKG